MTSATFLVTSVGPLVTVQDGGRPGSMRFGVPASGPMDQGSFAIANAALGNATGTPVVEISIGGLALECVEGSVTIALAGGGFQVDIGEMSFGSWIVTTLRPGARLVVKPGFWGSWTYLAFAGRIEVDPWLGSVATHAPSGFGGRKLAKGQSFTVAQAEIRDHRVGEIPCPVSARPRRSLKVVLGPQDRFFAAETIDALLSRAFALTDAYDRMGVRLTGPSLRPNATLDMPSEAIVRGSVQVSGDGVATVLLADHQTTGGYPKIATIVSGDLDGFVQLRARSPIAFTSVTPKAAIEAARTRRRTHDHFLASLQRRQKPDVDVVRA